MFSVAEEEDSRCSRFNPPLMFILKEKPLKYTTYHINKSGPCYTCLKQQLEENLKVTFASPSRKSDEKEKEEKLERQLQSFLRDTQTR